MQVNDCKDHWEVERFQFDSENNLTNKFANKYYVDGKFLNFDKDYLYATDMQRIHIERDENK